jgi:hypothetical protein
MEITDITGLRTLSTVIRKTTDSHMKPHTPGSKRCQITLATSWNCTVYIPGSALSIQSAIHQESAISRSYKMRYITTVVLSTIGATVQALPTPVSRIYLGKDLGLGLSVGPSSAIVGGTVGEVLADTGLATLGESESKVESCRPNTDLGYSNADRDRFQINRHTREALWFLSFPQLETSRKLATSLGLTLMTGDMGSILTLGTSIQVSPTVDNRRIKTDLGDLNANRNQFRPTDTQEKRCDF